VADRAVAPVVGKLLAAGLAVLFVAGTTAALLGGIVPAYRTEVGGELADRVLAEAAASVERAVPDTDATTSVRIRVDLPASIRGTAYTLVLRDGRLLLDHPDDRLDAQTTVGLPPGVATAESRWESGGSLVVRVSEHGANRTVRLEGAS
jgi:hypothetical protein